MMIWLADPTPTTKDLHVEWLPLGLEWVEPISVCDGATNRITPIASPQWVASHTGTTKRKQGWKLD